MNKTIFIGSNEYSLNALARKSSYFSEMLIFPCSDRIDLSHRGIAYEIIIKLLLDEYYYNVNYLDNINEIISIAGELMLTDNVVIKNYIKCNNMSPKQMCHNILRCFRKIKQYNKKVINKFDLKLSFQHNKELFIKNKLNFNFDIIRDIYIYKEFC